MKLRLVLLSLLAAATAHAGDLEVSLAAFQNLGAPQTTLRGDDDVNFVVQLRNRGDESHGVVVNVESEGTAQRFVSGFAEANCTQGASSLRCTIPTIAANGSGQISFTTRVPARNGSMTTRVEVTSLSPDPDPADNTATLTNTLVLAPDISVSAGGTRQRIVSNGTERVTLYVSNLSNTRATNVTATLRLTGGAEVVRILGTSDGFDCTIVNGEAHCTIASLAFGGFGAYADLEVRAPKTTVGGRIDVIATASLAEADFNPANNESTGYFFNIDRDFIVSNTNDAGAGSLRQAILDLDAACRDTGCRIVFNIEGAVPADGWFTIRPESPLPKIEGYAVVDGATQTAFSGDTNPDGPEIEIRGDRQAFGDGLTFGSGCELQLFRVAVGDFAHGHAVQFDNGVAIRPSYECHEPRPYEIGNNMIGVDPRGRAARPNFRGIATGKLWSVRIHDNVIANSVRSGIFLYHGVWAVVERNQIRDSGASGIYSGLDYVDIWDNAIARSGEFGIARPERGSEAGILRNTITASGLTAIDTGLDLVTDTQGNDSERAPNAPVLTSAFYDAATGKTTIHGSIESTPFALTRGHLLSLYAVTPNARGFLQPEVYAGEFQLTGLGEFDAVIEGDYRGRTLAATYTRSHFVGLLRAGADSFGFSSPDDTSELSNGVVVR